MPSGAFEVVVEYADNPLLKDARQAAPVRAREEDGFIVRPRLTGLKPGTEYWYCPMAKRPGRQPRLRSVS